MLEYARFQNPPPEYRPAPFWFWNDKIENGEITRQMGLMKEQDIRECFIHARYGLETVYLSEDWFARIAHAVREAKKLEMGLWLYDECNFPSGYAGGRVLAENPDYRGKNIRMTVLKPGDPLAVPENAQLAVLLTRETDGRFIPADGEDHSRFRWMFTIEYTRWKTAFSEDLYIDVLNPEATEVFLRVTHEEYRRRFEEEFGGVIRGFFSDEAGFYNNLRLAPWSDPHDEGTLVWTKALPAYFERRNGYDLLNHLPYLFVWDAERSPATRRDFFDTACSLYREAFLLPQRNYCHRYGMAFVGHLHCEDYLPLQITTQGSFTRALSAFTYAGCDRIDYNRAKLTEKLAGSVASQYGQARTLSESFAQGGWGFNFQDMKRWADYQYVRGVNFLVPHAFFYSVRDGRRYDAPPSFFFQSPYYPYYHLFSDYIARLGAALTAGRSLCALAVYYPEAAAQTAFDPDDWQTVRALDRDMQNVALGLLDAQYDFLFLNDEAFDGLTADGKNFCAGRGVFRALLVPAAPYIPFRTMEAMARLARAGVPVVFLKYRPLCVEAEKQAAFAVLWEEMTTLPSVAYVDEYHLYRQYTYAFDPACLSAAQGFRDAVRPLVELREADDGLKCMAREIDGSHLYFLVNEQPGEKEHRCVFRENKPPVMWDATTGRRSALPFTAVDKGIEVVIQLAPYASVLLEFGGEVPPTAWIPRPDRRKYLDGPWTLRVGGIERKGPLAGWQGCLPGYAGEGVYETRVLLEDDEAYSSMAICIGTVHDMCEVEINEKSIGELLWKPYRLETALFRSGWNKVRIKAVNTLASVYDEPARPSGIEGPVYLEWSSQSTKVREREEESPGKQDGSMDCP